MPRTQAPTHAEAVAFYKAALAAAQALDVSSADHLLDEDADAAWRAYGSDLPVLMRLELVLKNLAALYPAAFAPGPVFDLSGWYDDDPWGTGFARPPREELEALWRQRSAPQDERAALDAVAQYWTVHGRGGVGDLAQRLSPATNVVVAGASATAELAKVFLADEKLEARTQVLLVSDQPAARQLLGVTCALSREQGVPRMIRSKVEQADKAAEAVRFRQASVALCSSDASAEERATADALAGTFSVETRLEVGAS